MSRKPGTYHFPRYAVAGAAIGMLATPAAAETSEQPFNLRAGALFTSVDTRVEIEPNIGSGDGTIIDLESDLGFRRRPTIGFVEAGYRFAPRWTATFQYLSISRSSSASLDRDIVVGDTTYPVAAQVNARFNANVYMAHLGWSPIKTDKIEAGVKLGAHVTTFGFRIAGVGSVGGNISGAREERRTVTAPLPNGGVFVSAEVLPRVRFKAHADYLQLRVKKVTGRLTDLEANVSYQISPNFAVGTGYRHLGYRLKSNRDLFDGVIRYKFDGPVLFVEASF